MKIRYIGKTLKLITIFFLFFSYSNLLAQMYSPVVLTANQNTYLLPKNTKLELRLSGEWHGKDWLLLQNKMKLSNISNIKISLLKNFTGNDNSIVDFIKFCSVNKIVIDECNLQEFNYDNTDLIIVFFDNIQYFKGLAIDITEMPMELLSYLENKLRSLGMSVIKENQEIGVKQGKTVASKNMVLTDVTGSIEFYIQSITVISNSQMPQNNPQKANRNHNEENTNSSYVLSRAKMLMTHKEIGNLTKIRIKELIDKLENMNAKNPQNESERSRIFNTLEMICGIQILKKEDKLDSVVNKMFWALKNKENDKLEKLKKEVLEKLWSKVEMTPRNKYAAEQIITYINEIIHRRLINDPEYQEQNKSTPTIKQEFRRFAMLLHGAPGLGKTKIPQEMADSLGIPYAVLNAGDEKKFFAGGDSIFAGSEPGAIARYFKALCGGENIKNNKGSSTMIFIIDEVDKYPTEVQYQLLNLFDPSQFFIDQNLKAPPQIENVIFCLTANNIQNVIAPLRDRCLVIEFPRLSMENKIKIAKKDLINAFGEKNLLVENKTLEIIVRHSKGSGARQLKQDIAQIIQYIKENSKLPAVITEQVINAALLRKSKIKSYDIHRSDVGYMNCVFNYSKRNNIPNQKEKGFALSYLSCCSFEENKNSGDNINVDPYNQSTIAMVKVIQPLVQRTLHNLSFSNKGVSISFGSNKLDYSDKNSFYSCLMIVWISAVTNKKIKSQSTIIAAMLPNGQLLSDPDVEAKIEKAYQAGIRYIVVAKNRIAQVALSFALHSVQEHHKQRIVGKKSALGDNNIYIPVLSDKAHQCLHPGLEIYGADNINEALSYLLIDN
jgi:MoxR-like ATPase